MVVSNFFYVHPYSGKIPILTNIFQRGWNHQLVKKNMFGFRFSQREGERVKIWLRYFRMGQRMGMSECHGHNKKERQPSNETSISCLACIGDHTGIILWMNHLYRSQIPINQPYNESKRCFCTTHVILVFQTQFSGRWTRARDSTGTILYSNVLKS